MTKTINYIMLAATSMVSAHAGAIAGNSASVTAGTTISLSVAASGDAPFTYQWWRNGWQVPGGNSPTLKLDKPEELVAHEPYMYWCWVTNTAGTTKSNDVYIQVTPAVYIPTIQEKEQQAATAAGLSYDAATRKFGKPDGLTGEEEDSLHAARKILGLAQ